MNPIKVAIEELFQSRMQNMSFVAYFSYLSEAGKITARSMMDLCTIFSTYIDAQEKKNELYEANFKDIEGILSKLTSKTIDVPVLSHAQAVDSVSDQILDLRPEDSAPVIMAMDTKELFCAVCGKEAKSALGLQSHMRTHNKEEKVL